MIRHARRAISIRSTLLLTGTALALATVGCGGGGDSGGTGGATGTGGTIVRNDAAPVLPDTAPPSPDLGKDIAPGVTGGAGGGLDAGLGGAGGSFDTGAGGAVVIVEAGPPDKPLGAGGTGGDGGPDVAVGIDAVKPDTAPGIDTGPYVCPTPLKAWTFGQVPSLNSIAWNQDGTLFVGVTSTPGTPTTTFGPAPADSTVTPVVITNNGSADIIVSKLNPNTANPNWAIGVGDPKDQKVTGVAATSSGLGVLGTFTGSLEIVTGSPIVNSASGLVDFIAGLKDVDGSGVWSKKVNLGGGQLLSIASQPNKDYFVVCGSAMNAAANLNAVGTPGGGKDVVVAAIKASDGTILWGKLFGGASDQACTAAALDDDGNAIFAGTFAGALDFGLGALAGPAGGVDGGVAGATALWIAKLNGATGATMAATSVSTSGQITPYGLTADAQGNVIVTGYFQGGSVTFGSTVLTPVAQDAFVAKLDSSLASSSWARRWGSDIAAGKAVAVDSRGIVTVVGNFRGTLDLGPGTTDVLTSALPTVLESYVVALDGATGKTLCRNNYGDAASSAGGASSIIINRWATGANRDSVAIAGSFNKTINFGGQTTALASTTIYTQSYLLRM